MTPETRDLLDYMNVAGTWVSGIATTAAVGVSLWLAMQSERVKLRIAVELQHSRLYGGGVDGFRMIVTNVGQRTVKITRAYFEHKTDEGMRQSDRLDLGGTNSSEVVLDLAHGHQLRSFYQKGDTAISGRLLGVDSWLSRSTLRLCVETSLGVVVKWKPDNAFLEYVEPEIAALRTAIEERLKRQAMIEEMQREAEKQVREELMARVDLKLQQDQLQ